MPFLPPDIAGTLDHDAMRMGTQITLICTLTGLPELEPAIVPNGGSARGEQRSPLRHWPGNPTRASAAMLTMTGPLCDSGDHQFLPLRRRSSDLAEAGGPVTT
jgi:hypothetical protein